MQAPVCNIKADAHAMYAPRPALLLLLDGHAPHQDETRTRAGTSKGGGAGVASSSRCAIRGNEAGGRPEGDCKCICKSFSLLSSLEKKWCPLVCFTVDTLIISGFSTQKTYAADNIRECAI